MDDLDKYIRETRKQAKDIEIENENNWFTRLKRRVIGLEAIATFIYSVYAFFRKYLVIPIWKVIRFFWKHYHKVWVRFAYITGDNEKRKFSKTKGSFVVGMTLAIIYIGIVFSFFVKDFGFYMMTAQRDEVVYLSNAQEVDATNNVHSVQGCIVAMQDDGSFSCSTENSLYFRIEPSLFAHSWYLINRGDIFYPDYVAATIAPGWQECTITSYGFRAKPFIRRLQIYPNLLSVDCQKI